MNESASTRRSVAWPAWVSCVIVALAMVNANRASASIIVLEQVGAHAEELKLDLNGLDSSAASSLSSSREPSPIPAEQGDEDSQPLDIHKAIAPFGNSSTSSSTSASGGGVGATTVLCLPSAAVTISDDRALGQLPEDHGLSLPTPPGTDLLRPPQS